MAIPMVQVRHKTTGAKTFLPETALRNFPDYVKTPSQKSRDQVPDGSAFPAAHVVVEDDGQEPQRPQKNDSTESWRTYAVARGMAEDEAAAMGRDELVAHYDTQDA